MFTRCMCEATLPLPLKPKLEPKWLRNTWKCEGAGDISGEVGLAAKIRAVVR